MEIAFTSNAGFFAYDSFLNYCDKFHFIVAAFERISLVANKGKPTRKVVLNVNTVPQTMYDIGIFLARYFSIPRWQNRWRF